MLRTTAVEDPADDARLDARTARRLSELRAGCPLPVAQVHGSLEGRTGAEVRGIAMEPGGRFAAVVTHDSLQRWDLDAIELAGSWSLPSDVWLACILSAGETPGGLHVIDHDGQRWRGGAPAGALTVDGAEVVVHLNALVELGAHHAGVWDAGRGTVTVVRADGAVRCDVRLDPTERAWCDPEGRCVVVERSRPPSLDVLEVVEGAREPRLAARLPLPERRLGRHVAVHVPTRRLALVTARDATVGAWDDWGGARTFPMPFGAGRPCEFVEGGRTLVVGRGQSLLRLDTGTGEVRETRFEAVSHLAIDPASGRVACVGGAGCVFVADAGREVARGRASGPLGAVVAVAAAAGGRALVTAASDGSLQVRDRATAEVLTQIECPAREPQRVVVTPDGREVLAVGAGGSLSRWSLATGERVGGAELYRREPCRAAALASPDGRYVALTRERKRNSVAGSDAGVHVVAVVDLTTGTTRFVDPCAGDDFMSPALHPLAFEPGEPMLRGVACDFSAGRGDRLTFWRYHVERDAFEPEGEPREGDLEVLLPSADGRSLWCDDRESDGDVVVIPAVAGPEPPPIARWAFGESVHACCAGRSLLACTAEAGGRWLLSRNGRSWRLDLDRGVVPLAFAPDDRALWVRDRTGLVFELLVPEELLAG